jgi:5-formyltetrahydrofolate cyclo-ligase
MPKGEAQTGPVLSSLFTARKRVFVPKVVGKSSSDMRMPELRSVAELKSLTLSPWGIPEFTAQQLQERADGLLSDEALVDVVLAPGVAFTERCERLGHGKGYYDSFLAALQRRRAALGLPPAFCVGLCLDEQVQPSVPLSEHDVLLDAVVTPTRLFVRR